MNPRHDRRPFLPARRWAMVLVSAILFMSAFTACERLGLARPITPSPSPTAPLAAPPPTKEATFTPTAPPATATPTPRPTLPAQPMVIGQIALPSPYEPGLGPVGIAIIGARAYVANANTDNVSILEGNAVRAVVRVGHAPRAIVADAALGRAYILSEQDSAITVLEGDSVKATWPLADPPYSAALAPNGLWVASLYNGILTLLSVQNGQPLQRFALPEAPTLYSLAASPDGASLYAAGPSRLYRIDIARTQVEAADLSNLRTIALSPDGRTLYLARYDEATSKTAIEARDANTLAPIGQGPSLLDLSALALSPQGDRLYALSSTTGELWAWNLPDFSEVGHLVVGLGPAALALDPTGSLAYVANSEGASVAVIDTRNLSRVDTVPLAYLIEDMAIHPTEGTLYVALSSADRIMAYREGAWQNAWRVSPYPSRVAYIAPLGQLAVLSHAEGTLTLLDSDGRIAARYTVGAKPRGLTVDLTHRRIYAGGAIVDWEKGSATLWYVPDLLQGQWPPIQILLDTRRDVPYAVAFNGIPGSNGGYIIARWNGERFDPSLPAPGKLSVAQALYDEKMDRFYATYARMGTFGLQVSNAEDCAEIADIPLERYPTALVLNPATWHMWVVLPALGQAEPGDTLVRAYDTRTLGLAAEIVLPERLGAATLDAANGLLYLASQRHGRVYILQDVPLPAPAQALAQPTASPQPLTPKPTVTPPAPTPTRTPTRKPTPTATKAPPPPTCVGEADPRLLEAWKMLGAEAGMGCAYTFAEESPWAVQPFEHGLLYWHGAAQEIIALLEDGRWLTFEDLWREGMPTESCQAQPPADRYLPIRGFGHLWCREASLRDALGWATAPEQGFQGVYQTFAKGAILREPDGSVKAFRHDGTWQRLKP